MKRIRPDSFLKLFLLLFISFFSINQQAIAQNFTISGFVRDAGTGEELIGANVIISGTTNGATTNVYGFYSLTLPAGSYQLVASYLGYEAKELTVDLSSQNQSLDIELSENAEMLSEVVVTDKKEDDNVTNVEMSVAKLDVNTIKKIPALLGEVDIIKAIQLLPGVSTVGEGATGFNVRGGGIDQNLVLLDEAPVYNQSHLFGFFSVFNPDAVKNVKLFKGGIPAEYGGRASSILDIRMKDGNNQRFAGQGGVGLIFSRLTLEAPLPKEKGSFVVAGRRSYIDIISKPFLEEDLQDSKFNFYDLTLKANYVINDKNRIFLSGYFGRDVFESGFGFNWGNGTGTLRWNSILTDKLFMNVSAIYSNYDYALGVSNDNGEGFDWDSQIVNYSLKNSYDWFLNNNHSISFGFEGLYYNFKPARASFTSGGETTDFSLDDKYALESAAYISNEQKVSDKLTLQYGLRVSGFHYLGATTVFELEDKVPDGNRPEVINTYEAKSGELIKDYYNLEPRFSANYVLNKSTSFKASYNRLAQYIHLASNTAASSPLDIWLPSSNNILPQKADQVALGVFKNFKDNMFETSVEVYYKDLQNQLGYVRGADLFLNNNLESEIIQGIGRAYGAELYIKKNKGALTGWLSYTLSRSEQKIQGINNGDWFNAKFDKPHNLTLVGIYSLNKYWDFSATFTLSSGIPATFPTHTLFLDDRPIPVNALNEQNNQRLPAYHRMDISFTKQSKKNDSRRWQSEWVFGLYNAYARRNAFSVYFRQNEDRPLDREAIQLSILGTVLPSVSYNFKF